MSEKDPGHTDFDIDLTCAQVPTDFVAGSEFWLWLGSHNNKGQATPWTQGVRAFGRCVEKVAAAGTRIFDIKLKITYVLTRSIEKAEFLQTSPLTYADKLSETPIVGLNNYQSQVVQTLSDEQFMTLAAFIARLDPDTADDLLAMVPDAADVVIIERDPDAPVVEPEHEILTADIEDADPVYQEVLRYIEGDEFGGVLLQGAPGTGKTWYARQIAIKLTGGDSSRIRRVQFHPSYQYEDFVEGYVPRDGGGFKLEKKHLLLAVEKAKRTEGPVVLIIDEFSRTDPSRVLGEVLTYMEGSLRDEDFLLSSGTKTRIPRNLVFLATMNPEDRSVDEIDAAMERRWAKVTILPDASKVADFLRANNAPNALIEPVVGFFNSLQKHAAVGHAFFRKVRDVPSLQRLWESQLRHLLAKRYRYDKKAQQTVDDMWLACQLNASAAVDFDNPAPTTLVTETPTANAA